MTINARFVHVNLGAQDWKKLAEFYQRVFGREHRRAASLEFQA